MPRVFTRRQHRVRQVRYTLVRARARITVFSRKGHRIPMRIGFDNDKYIAAAGGAHPRAHRASSAASCIWSSAASSSTTTTPRACCRGFEPDSKIRMLQKLKDDVRDRDRHQRQRHREEQGAGRPGHHLRRGRAAAHRRLPRSGLLCGQRGHHPVRRPAGGRRLPQAAGAAWGSRATSTIPSPDTPPTSAHIVSDEGLRPQRLYRDHAAPRRGDGPGPRQRQDGHLSRASSTTTTSRGIPAGYAKYETFPIWNLPLKHPVNLAYEAATADLNDVNMIDPFHLDAYGEHHRQLQPRRGDLPRAAPPCSRRSRASAPTSPPPTWA